MKNVFIVTGSEDGILGVFTNKKLAYEKAHDYVEQNGGAVQSYSNTCKSLREGWFAYVDSKDGYGNATIEKRPLNEKYN